MSAAISQDPDETPAPTPTAPSKPTASVTHPQAQSPKGLLTRARKARAEQIPPPPPIVMDLADQDGLNVSLSCEFKVVSEFRGFDEALTAK